MAWEWIYAHSVSSRLLLLLLNAQKRLSSLRNVNEYTQSRTTPKRRCCITANTVSVSVLCPPTTLTFPLTGGVVFSKVHGQFKASELRFLHFLHNTTTKNRGQHLPCFATVPAQPELWHEYRTSMHNTNIDTHTHSYIYRYFLFLLRFPSSTEASVSSPLLLWFTEANMFWLPCFLQRDVQPWQ